jgi:hypothetical protein
VLDEAERFFGPDGLGLERRDDSASRATWQGGGTAVFLSITPLDEGTRVEVASAEWDRQVREFIGKLKRRFAF